jgi:hypothetical protein
MTGQLLSDDGVDVSMVAKSLVYPSDIELIGQGLTFNLPTACSSTRALKSHS